MANRMVKSKRSIASLNSLEGFGLRAEQQSSPKRRRIDIPIDLSIAENWSIRPELVSLFRDVIRNDLSPEPSQIALAPGSSNGFDFHFAVHPQVHPIIAPMNDLEHSFDADALLESLTVAYEKSSLQTRAVVLTTPGNPLGQCYTKDTLQRCAKFCQDRDLHLICDEVYALSYFAKSTDGITPFQSILTLNLASLACDPSRIHMVWSLSKDFGCSGLRLGCVVSQANPNLILALRLPTSTEVSALTTLCTTALLTSPALADLVKVNRERLAESYKAVTDVLQAHSVQYIPAMAGLFVFARLKPNATAKDETNFQQRLRIAGIIISHSVTNTKMDATLSILSAALKVASAQLQGPLNAERLAALHNHSEGKLPDVALGELAGKTIDLLHQIEQLLEPSSLVLADHFLGYLNSKCLCAAVEFHIPDLLANGPRTLAELAQLSGAREDRLRQVLRVLHNNGIFTCSADKETYRNNPTSEMLKTDHWTQWHNWVDLYGNEFYDMARGIPASLRQGTVRTPAQINFDTDENMFDYFTRQGWLPRLHRTLGGGATAQAPGILADYPWEEFGDKTFLDIGGGEGALIALILRQHPGMQGALLDTPEVIEHAQSLFKSGNGRLSRYADLTMMVSADGQERTEAQWRSLAGRTRWEIRQVRKLRGAWPSDQTSYINYIKPLIFARELKIPHLLSVIDTKEEWFYRIHPERMVPSLKDQDPENKQEVIVFESTACLQYLADRFDVEGSWTGRNATETGAVLSWTAYQTAALGLHSNCLRQWDILDKRLSLPGHDYVALPDRPTLADLSYFPFAMPWMFNFLGVDIHNWPHIERWSQRLLGRPAVKAVLEMAPRIGH
ncbi:pyridoxal phosphate-dependent transferase [Aspergillus pseudoustus]|uniref:Pyridoxal phosphate-dependent transferase n=1 Tax=Aspergillus pseudoustus TaxID=1810923 RepID=A0ABR4JRT0_9EURO